jgi:hypothetical protein
MMHPGLLVFRLFLVVATLIILWHADYRLRRIALIAGVFVMLLNLHRPPAALPTNMAPSIAADRPVMRQSVIGELGKLSILCNGMIVAITLLPVGSSGSSAERLTKRRENF